MATWAWATADRRAAQRALHLLLQQLAATTVRTLGTALLALPLLGQPWAQVAVAAGDQLQAAWVPAQLLQQHTGTQGTGTGTACRLLAQAQRRMEEGACPLRLLGQAGMGPVLLAPPPATAHQLQPRAAGVQDLLQHLLARLAMVAAAAATALARVAMGGCLGERQLLGLLVTGHSRRRTAATGGELTRVPGLAASPAWQL